MRQTKHATYLRTHPSVPDHVAEDLATLPGLHGPAAAILGADHYAVKATLSQASILEPLGRDSVAGSIASREGESSTRLVTTSVTTGSSVSDGELAVGHFVDGLSLVKCEC